jgi:hypothetical protein
MSFLADLIVKLVDWLFSLSKQDVSSEDAKKQPELKRDLLACIDEHERGVRESSDLRPPR